MCVYLLLECLFGQGGIPSSLPSFFSAGGLSESRKEETGKEICVYTVGLGWKEEVEISGPCKYSIRTEKFKINVQHGISLILCLREEGNIFVYLVVSLGTVGWREGRGGKSDVDKKAEEKLARSRLKSRREEKDWNSPKNK